MTDVSLMTRVTILEILFLDTPEKKEAYLAVLDKITGELDTTVNPAGGAELIESLQKHRKWISDTLHR